ncbi:MAG: amidohydrolase [Chitinophagaceae bacterium]|nr:MAG: amidohydrolase [Chitinophagaceae bacterium]
MGYRKFKADRLFDGYRFREGEVLVTDDGGRVADLVPAGDAGDNIEQYNGILSPGFINCHCHLELSHMKGLIPEGTGLVPFVGQVMAGRSKPEDEILAAIDAAENEMYDNGIVAVGDICNTAYTIDCKKGQRLRYYNFIEVSGFDPALAEMRFETAKELSARFEFAANGQQPMPWSIVPHSPYSVSGPLWEKIIHNAGSKLLSIHNQEDPAENEFFEKKEGAFMGLYEKMKLDIHFFSASGKSSLRTYLTRLPASQPLILVHNVFTSAEDLLYVEQLTASPSIYWCLCPRANRYISTVLPDVPLLMQQGRRIVFGTDSLASNHRLDIVSEISLVREFYPAIADSDLLTWATSNGAAALQLQDEFGSFEKGKKPGVVLVDEHFTGANRLL